MREVVIKQDVKELSRAAADLFIRIASEAIKERGAFSVVLAGGSTPKMLYSLLASEFKTAIDWTKVHFFFGDERNVPDDSLDSNYRMVAESLFLPLSISSANVWNWMTELGPAEAAAAYELSIELACDPTLNPSRNYSPEEAEELIAQSNTWVNDLPHFDLILLGLGADGHTASLFPNTDALREQERLAKENWVEQIDDYRLTLTFPVINNAANIVFLVSGVEKAPAVAKVLEGEFRPDEFPAQLVQPVDGNLYWYLDQAAARDLLGDP